jgi:DNA-binding transcriptional regulator GbsR (MarR family)
LTNPSLRGKIKGVKGKVFSIITYNGEAVKMNNELLILKDKIKNRMNDIQLQLAQAMINGNNNEIRTLREQEIQCFAELRVLRYIENNYKEPFVIC